MDEEGPPLPTASTGKRTEGLPQHGAPVHVLLLLLQLLPYVACCCCAVVLQAWFLPDANDLGLFTPVSTRCSLGPSSGVCYYGIRCCCSLWCQQLLNGAIP